MRCYQLEANTCGVWSKTTRVFGCEPWEFPKMLAALGLSEDQRLRRIAADATAGGKLFSSGRFVGRFVTLSKGR